MNKDKIKGSLNQLKGEAKEQWGKATNDRSTETEGKLDKVKGKVQEGVGKVKEKWSYWFCLSSFNIPQNKRFPFLLLISFFVFSRQKGITSPF